MFSNLRDLNFQQLQILKELRAHSSLRSLCSSLHLQASNISRDLGEIENILQVELIKTSSKGFTLTADGLRVSQIASEVWQKAEELSLPRELVNQENLPLHTIGARGYLNLLATKKFSANRELMAQCRLRFLDVSPQEMIQLALLGLTDSLLHFEKFDLPSSWMTHALVNDIKWRFHASQDHPLVKLKAKKNLELEDVLNYPFVVSTAWNGREIVNNDDGLPVPWAHRKRGSEAQTALMALQIASQTNQICFLPDIFANLFLPGQLATFDLPDTEKIQKSLQLSVHTTRVSLRVFNMMVQTFQSSFQQQQEENLNEKNVNSPAFHFRPARDLDNSSL